jgi:SAM-dependent methyltransferase
VIAVRRSSAILEVSRFKFGQPECVGIRSACREKDQPVGRASIAIAKRVLKLWPAPPPDPETPGGLQEIFTHQRFLEASQEQRLEIMRASSRWKHRDELDYPWDHYFGVDLASRLRGKSILDLGCFTGGRSVAWAERYDVAALSGVDVEAVFIEAARRFSCERGIEADFRLGHAESVPYEDGVFDGILSFDVFEHVQDVRAALVECRRVLKPGGSLYVVFPGYFHPVEHHLGLVTRLPGVHYLFTGATLVAAYTELLHERGPEHAWYARAAGELGSWERGHTINGTTFRGFRKLVAETNWKVCHQSNLPVGRVGRAASRQWLARLIGYGLTPLAHLPGTQEIVLHRIACILEKR